MDNIGSITGRLWVKMLIMMGVLTLVGPLIDYFNFVQGIFGTVNNLSAIIMFAFSGIFAANLKYLREPGDRQFLLIGLGLMMAVFLRTILDKDTEVFGGTGGVIVVLFAVLSGYAAYALARRGLEVHEWAVRMVMLTSIFLPLAVLLVALRPDGEEPYYLNVYGYSNIRVLGYFAAGACVALSLMWGWVKGRENKTEILAYVLMSSVSWSMLYWSGSRTAFVATVTSIALSWLVIKRPNMVEFGGTLSTMFAGFMIHLSYPMPTKHFGFVDRIEQTVNGLSSGDMTRISTNRSDLWAWAIERIMEAPIIGHGLYAMSHLRVPEFNFYHTHNVILEYALGVGIPLTLVIVVVVLILYVRAGLAAKRSKDPYAVACFGIVTMAAIAAQFSAALFFPFYLTVFMAGLAGLVSLYKDTRN